VSTYRDGYRDALLRVKRFVDGRLGAGDEPPPLGPPTRPDRDPPDDEPDAPVDRPRMGRQAPVVRVPVETPEVDDRTVIGVKGDFGPIYLDEHFEPTAYVGLTPDATVGPLIQKGRMIGPLEFHNIGIRPAPDSFCFRQLAPLGRLVLKNWWFVGANQTSGLHLGKGWDFLHVEGYQPRDSRFLEHVLYIKGGGRTQIVDNEMLGSGRSFVQYRPHGAGTDPYPFDATPLPSGPILIEGNKSKGFGYDHEQIGGGAVITVWCSLEWPVVIRNNEITNCRTGGIMVGQGATNTHPPLTDDGYSHSLIWIEGNTVESTGSQGADPRHAVSISAARDVVFAGKNTFASDRRYDLVVDADFSARQGARRCGRVHMLERPQMQKTAHWVSSLDRYVEGL